MVSELPSAGPACSLPNEETATWAERIGGLGDLHGDDDFRGAVR